MTHINYSHIDRTVKANKLYRFTNELNEQINENEPEQDGDRIADLTVIINELNLQKDKKQISDEKMQAHFEILKNSQYQKRWQSLSTAQRLNRLEEFIERNQIEDDVYINKLKRGVNESILRTKDVKYSMIKGCIEEINTSELDKLTSISTPITESSVSSKTPKPKTTKTANTNTKENTKTVKRIVKVVKIK